jgi:Cell division protein CrgA
MSLPAPPPCGGARFPNLAADQRPCVRTSQGPSWIEFGIRHPSAVRSLAWQVFDYATYFNSKENLVPESRTRKSAEEKQKLKAQQASKPKKIKAPASRRWVPPAFITVGLLGVAWLITYYVAGTYIPFMDALGNWNILIGMGGMAAAFVIATLWR